MSVVLDKTKHFEPTHNETRLPKTSTARESLPAALIPRSLRFGGNRDCYRLSVNYITKEADSGKKIQYGDVVATLGKYSGRVQSLEIKIDRVESLEQALNKFIRALQDLKSNRASDGTWGRGQVKSVDLVTTYSKGFKEALKGGE